ARDAGPIDASCACAVCARWSRAYLRHLFVVNEPGAARLVTIHNLAWISDLVRRVRDAVVTGRLTFLRAEVAATWSAGEQGGSAR
ncbi:MAG: tRNA guanosine(34) transglycosylase Tgt, partial [Acidimicrobiia bacterium]